MADYNSIDIQYKKVLYIGRGFSIRKSIAGLDVHSRFQNILSKKDRTHMLISGWTYGTVMYITRSCNKKNNSKFYDIDFLQK